MHDLRAFPTAEALAEGAADLLAAELATVPSLALAGGSTPEATYRALAARDLDWGRLDLWLGDERWVPPTHPDANLGMAARALGPGARRILPTPWAEGIGPKASADAYARLLRTRLGGPDRLEPGIVLLGMGDDGHTASLFPGSSALDDLERDYTATFVAHLGAWRLTLTLPAIHRAALVVVLVAGAAKATTLAAALSEDSKLPISVATSGADRVVWLVDEAAATAT